MQSREREVICLTPIDVCDARNDSFMLRLDVCWSSLAGKAADLELRGDRTASLRALLLAAAVADGALPSIVEAQARLARSYTSP